MIDARQDCGVLAGEAAPPQRFRIDIAPLLREHKGRRRVADRLP
jgi:hypothetical protein